MAINKKNNGVKVVYLPINTKACTIKDLSGKPFLNVYRKKDDKK